jgi:myo-inositol-1-phosphate synthase
MLDRSRLVSKKESKTEAVQSQTKNRLEDENIHIGPSDWVAWQKDNKICFLRMMKHPPRQFTDDEAYRLTEDFIKGKRED